MRLFSIGFLKRFMEGQINGDHRREVQSHFLIPTYIVSKQLFKSQKWYSRAREHTACFGKRLENSASRAQQIL